MNTIKNIFKALAIFALAFSAASCGDYPDGDGKNPEGKPVIKYIRYSDRDVIIDQAYMKETICLVGENLNSIHEIWFNDQQAILNTSLITPHTLLVTVPKNMPEEKTDKIYIVTFGGEKTAYDFKVLPPAPVVSSMSCEMAKPGSVVTIYGDYFYPSDDFPVAVEFPNAEVTEYLNVTPTAITVRIPENAAAGKVKVTTASGVGGSDFRYLDDRGLLFDFDGQTGISDAGQCWHERVKTTDETAINGTYLRLGDGVNGLDKSASWNDGQYSFEYWCGSWDDPQNITSGTGIALYNLVDFSNAASMTLKFEMCIPAENPWKSGAMQITFLGVDKVTLSGNAITGATTVAGANAYCFNNQDAEEDSETKGGQWGRAFWRPWEATGSYDTNGEWITVCFPIADFKYTRWGKETTGWCPSKPEDFASFNIFVFNGGVDGEECAPIFKIDNIRVVPNK